MLSILVLITLFLTPSFALRFSIGGVPANLLMLWVTVFWIIFGAYIILKGQVHDFLKFILSIDKKTALAIGLFFVSGVISLFVGGVDQKKIGQFIVLFFQPISLFFISGFIFQKYQNTKSYLIYGLYLFLAASGIYAIIQYFTLQGLPSYYWGNSVEAKRAISFFGHPDFYALFSAPLLAFLIPDVFNQFLNFKFSKLGKPVLWLIGAAGLFLSLSRAGWLGLTFAIIIYAIVSKNNFARKLITASAVTVILIVAAVPNWRYRLITPFYGEKSTSSRTQLWKDGLIAIKQSPILGLGLNGFSKQWPTINTDPAQNSANFPHNIFLDIWVDVGLLGLIGFVLLCGRLLYQGFKNSSHKSTVTYLPLAIFLFVLTFLIQGQFDNPYFRNDLALVFWVILSLN